MRVLLVEDEADLRESLVALLGERGHDTTALGTAEAAWAACRDALFPLIILDWGLPGRDGLWLCRQIRALPDGDTSVVLVVTARTGAEDLTTVLRAGASDYLAKPFDVDVLDVRLTIAEAHAAQVARRKRAELAHAAESEERARLEGVILTAREVTHRLNNELALAVGAVSLLEQHADLPRDLRALIHDANVGLDRAVDDIAKLQRVVRVATRDTPVGPALDLDRSTRPTND